jgi:pimeloyl-ACP methyl ester carboxylesterase
MAEREPIHLGTGEPVLLLHPFLMSQNVWKTVARQLADTGRYEVFAPTFLGHHGGPKAGTLLLDINKIADHVERQLDEIGWGSAHIVGNSLGGWAAFELERRGRARTVTGIAPAGGWARYSPGKFEIVFKFLAGLPAYPLIRLLGVRLLRIPFIRHLAYPAISASPARLSDDDMHDIVDNVAHCPAYYQLLIQVLRTPGLVELPATKAPAQLVICEKDRVVPPKRFARHFTENLPVGTRVITLDDVGHIPMFEAPGRVTEVITGFIDAHTVDTTRSAG